MDIVQLQQNAVRSFATESKNEMNNNVFVDCLQRASTDYNHRWDDHDQAYRGVIDLVNVH